MEKIQEDTGNYLKITYLQFNKMWWNKSWAESLTKRCVWKFARGLSYQWEHDALQVQQKNYPVNYASLAQFDEYFWKQDPQLMVWREVLGSP